MSEDPLSQLPRLDAKAMAPCILCQRQLLATGLPLFYRFSVKRCGIDGKEVQRHVGLANAMGGGEAGLILADVLGPGVKPVVVMDEWQAVNVCHPCAQERPISVEELAMIVMEATAEEPTDG